MDEIVAYRTSNSILCTDPECLALNAEAMLTARPMTQADVRLYQDNIEGETVTCASCAETLDLWTLTMGRQA